VTNTIYIPPGSKVVAESYSVIMSSGSKFSNINSPVPLVQVGHAGDSGSVQWSDMIVSTQGAQPGAVLIEWNLKASSGSGMWDVHTGIGGLLGSNLQVGQCPTSQTTPPPTASQSTCLCTSQPLLQVPISRTSGSGPQTMTSTALAAPRSLCTPDVASSSSLPEVHAGCKLSTFFTLLS
jgi:hypothetical protein